MILTLSPRQSAANTAKVDCYIGLRLEPGHESAATYFYRGFRYESTASRQLAELLVDTAANRLELGNAGAHGMAEVILRTNRHAGGGAGARLSGAGGDADLTTRTGRSGGS